MKLGSWGGRADGNGAEMGQTRGALRDGGGTAGGGGAGGSNWWERVQPLCAVLLWGWERCGGMGICGAGWG